MSYFVGPKILHLEKGSKLTSGVQPVLNKYTNKPFAYVKLSSKEEISNAIQLAKENESVMAKLKPPEKAAILSSLKSKIVQNKSLFAEVICLEAGKPIATARGEVERCIEVVSEAEREAIRGTAEDGTWRESTNASGTYSLLERRFPVGLLSFVTPFNFPLNLAMHKVAPAIAAGCPFVLKPSDQAPISAILLGELLAETDMPKGSFEILPCTLNEAPIFSLDERIKALSFTGSPAVGWHLKNTSGRKKVLLELGGDAAVIVDKGANVNDVISRIIFGAYGYAGQSCISVQRIIAHSDVYEQIKEGVARGAQKINEKKGDPTLESTLLGPVISEREAVRIESWVNESVSNGAKIVAGGVRDGAIYEATLLENVQTTDKVWQREVFGPICTIKKFDDFKEAINLVNQSEFGLQTGVYTSDVQKIFYSFEKLEVGGVVINDVPTTRLDTQPYGGIKSSGLGREGIRSGIEEFTEPKVLLLKNISHL